MSAPKARRDAISLLKKDHQTVKELFDAFEKAKETREMKAIVAGHAFTPTVFPVTERAWCRRPLFCAEWLGGNTATTRATVTDRKPTSTRA